MEVGFVRTMLSAVSLRIPRIPWLPSLARIKWFEENTRAIVIPAEVEVDEDIAFKAVNFSLAASQWACLEHAWDRSRLYGARFRVTERQFPV